MNILILNTSQANEVIKINNRTGKHLVPCDIGAGASVQSDFDNTIFAEQKVYLDSQNITPIGIMESDSEKLIKISRSILNTSIANYPSLPSTGLLKAGAIYSYSGSLVQVIQDHTRTIYPPNETPALFDFYRTSTGSVNWIAQEKVLVGDQRIYNSKTYKCLQAHQTQETWNPEATLGVLWQVVATTSEWAVGVDYKVNDIVTYQTKTYKCLQAHTSISTWYPSAVPALWKLQ